MSFRRVQETLQGVDAGRKAYRLVGDVLVERSVGEVLPAVSTNLEQVGPLCCRQQRHSFDLGVLE